MHIVQEGGRMVATWSQVETAYEPEANDHWRVAELYGLKCPFDVFEQLFHDHHGSADFAQEVRGVDWQSVAWEQAELSGVKLRQVAVPRHTQHAVDEARALTLAEGLTDPREEVIASWRDNGTWVRSPVLVEGAVLGRPIEYQMLVGYTRLGDLLGLLDREEVRESARHMVWIGRKKVG
jgi:hypothetical protein